MYIYRELNAKNIEIFRLSNDIYEETIAYLAIIDFKRPSTLKDFPYLIGIEEEFGSENFIKSLIITNDKIDPSKEEEILSIIEGLIGTKESCDWNANFELTSLDLNIVNFEEVYNEIKNILLNNFNYELDIDSIKNLNFNYLLQENKKKKIKKICKFLQKTLSYI